MSSRLPIPYATTLPEPFCAPVVITLPYFAEGEAGALAALSHASPGMIHIRKPGAAPHEIEALLGELRRLGADMSRFTLHYNEPLALRFGLGGVHLRGDDFLNRAARHALPGRDIPGAWVEFVGDISDDGEPAGKGVPDTGVEPVGAETVEGNIPDVGIGAPALRHSCSAHSWEEVRRWGDAVDYLFLSPLFDSISKKGYKASVEPREAARELAVSRSCRIVALGGIAPGNIVCTATLGFDGAAVLGALWVVRGGEVDVEQTLSNYYVLYRRWRAAVFGQLQFISDGDPVVAEHFLRGGGRWVQLRMKNAAPATIVSCGKELLVLCRRYGALLLVNDHPALAAEIGADGVHLGKNDMPPAEARAIVGLCAIIGCTANTFEDVERLAAQPVDYIGLGPFRFTTTKKNLSPVLGAEGYRQLMNRMRAGGIGLHVVAIGGITLEDIPKLMEVGVPGIAVSGALGQAVDVERVTCEFVYAIRRGRLSGV